MMCLPCSQHASTWRMPDAGLPVASITMSISGAAIIRAESSVMCTLSDFAASAISVLSLFQAVQSASTCHPEHGHQAGLVRVGRNPTLTKLAFFSLQ